MKRYHVVKTDDFDMLISGTVYHLNAIWLAKLFKKHFYFGHFSDIILK
jgi:hypothetical protein